MTDRLSVAVPGPVPGPVPAWATSVLSRRSFLAAVALAGASAGVLSACGSADSTSAVAKRHADGILQIGVAAAPSNINPLDSAAEVTRWIAEPVVECLYDYDDALASVPLLAAGEPQISADGLTWRIPLREGIRWHNGDLFTAADVVATLAHINDLGSGSEWITYLLGYIRSYRAVDEHTVEISLVKPYGLLRSHLTNLPITHRDYVNRKDAMMGTGPFKLDRYSPGQSFTMSAFDGYHGDKPALRGIQYTVFSDGSTRLLSLKQGKVDLITAVPYTQMSSVRSDKDILVAAEDAPVDILSYVNLATDPFSDENFRRAVAYATDRAGVVSRVFGGQATPGQGPIGPAELGYQASFTPYPVQPDYAKARDYLAKAATKTRAFTIVLGANEVTRSVATVLAAGWAQIGISVTLEQQPGNVWSQSFVGRKYQMLMNIFQSGFTSGPANYITLAPGDPANVLSCGYRNPEATTLTETIWQTSDLATRTAALQRLNQLFAEDAVIFPCAYPKLVVAQRGELSPVDPAMLRISRIRPQRLRFLR